MTARASIALAALALVTAPACGSKNSDDRRASKQAPAEPPVARPAARDAGPDQALWRTRVEGTPGEAVITWVNGPSRFGDEIWVGSSAIGVAALDPDTGDVLSHEPAAEPFVARPDDPDAPRAVRLGGEAFAVGRAAIERAGGWRYEYPEPAALGVAGPVRFPGGLALVVDETAIGLAWDDGRELWRAEGRFSHVDGSLAAGPGGVVRAVAVDRGVGPVVLDPRSGEIAQPGVRAAALQPLAAAWAPSGALAVVARRDASMASEVLSVFDAGGNLSWEWDLPRADAARIDPIGLLADGGGFVLFYDGRYVARFPAPAAP